MQIESTPDFADLAVPGDFGATDSNVLTYLRGKYGDAIEHVLDNALHRLSPPLADFLAPRIERHLFPHYVLGDALALPLVRTTELAGLLVACYSLPVTVIGSQLDGKTTSSPMDSLIIDIRNLEANKIGSDRTGYATPAACLLDCRESVEKSLLREASKRFSVDDLADPSLWTLPRLPGKFYRSECTYLRAVVGALFAALNMTPLPTEREGLYLFGVGRQLLDELDDVAEDITGGIVTLPVVEYVGRVNDLMAIDNVWSGKRSPQSLAEAVVLAGADRRSIDLIERAFRRAHKCLDGHPLAELRFFIHWKEAALADYQKRRNEH